MTTVLVTGVAGFIGCHVARALLRRGDRVIGIDNLDPYYRVQLKQDRLAFLAEDGGDRFRFVKASFADQDALDALSGEDIAAIIHLGAQAGVRHSIDSPRAYVQANLVGHLEMLELARTRQVPMVYASSSSVYGGNAELPFRVEDRADTPVSLYAATKRADELMSESYAHLYRIPLTGLRFFTVYGPWGRPDMAMWLFTDAILAGRPIRLFNGGDMRRDFTWIDDVVSGVLACHDGPPTDDGSRSPHRLYNIGNNRAEDLRHLVGLIEQTCGRSAIVEPAPMQPGDVLATYADISAIARDHGYAPTVSLAEGVPRFVRWFRDYHDR